MEAKDNTNVFQVYPNKFNNKDSEFVAQIPLQTNAKLALPFYAMLSVTHGEDGDKLIGVKTCQSIQLVYFKDTEFLKHERLNVDEPLLEQSYASCFNFKTDAYSPSNPPTMIIGHKTGLVAHVSCKNKLLGLYNHDEKNKASKTHKNFPVSMIRTVPDSNGDEILVVFGDSSVIKYHLNTKVNNNHFIEKLKRFEQKISFKENLNKFKHHKKTKYEICYGSELDTSPEFSFFYAINDSFPIENPLAYYKFNHRTITDMVIKKHPSFSRTLLKDCNKQHTNVLAFVSLDGFLVIYNYHDMTPRLSYSSVFGGFNSVMFSENCDLIALGGQDDCITILDLYSMKTLRCEGHKSFISRAIFQTIPFKNPVNPLKTTKGSEIENRDVDESRYVRVIGAGMDANLSFWEFDRNIVRGENMNGIKERNFPIRLKATSPPSSAKCQPVLMYPVKEAIAWIELAENLLFQSEYEGYISIYTIKDITKVIEPEKELEVSQQKKKNKEPTAETRTPNTSSYEQSGSKDKTSKYYRAEQTKDEKSYSRNNEENSKRKGSDDDSERAYTPPISLKDLLNGHESGK